MTLWYLRETCIDVRVLPPVSSKKIPELPGTINEETLSQFKQWELVEMILASPKAETLGRMGDRNIMNCLEKERVIYIAVQLLGPPRTAEENREAFVKLMCKA